MSYVLTFGNLSMDDSNPEIYFTKIKAFQTEDEAISFAKKVLTDHYHDMLRDAKDGECSYPDEKEFKEALEEAYLSLEALRGSKRESKYGSNNWTDNFWRNFSIDNDPITGDIPSFFFALQEI